MASKKKKKKKKKPGQRRAAYATGKKAEAEGQEIKAAQRPQPGAKGAEKPSGRSAEAKEQRTQQWNLVRGGTLEMKVMTALLVLIAAAAFLRLPLSSVEANRQYRDLKKAYDTEIGKFKEKYPTAADQKKHEKEKPKAPQKPTNGLLLLSIIVGALQSAIFAFLSLNIARRTDLGTPVLDKQLGGGRLDAGDLRPFLTWSVPAGLIMLAPLYLNARISTRIVNSLFRTAESSRERLALWRLVAGSFNDAVFYEMLFVFLLVSVFVWVFTRYRDRTPLEPHWAGIAVAFLITTAFFLWNVSSGTSGSGVHVSLQTLLGYAVSLSAPVLILGFLYWKKGLEYCLLAGLLGFGVYPLLASVITK